MRYEETQFLRKYAGIAQLPYPRNTWRVPKSQTGIVQPYFKDPQHPCNAHKKWGWKTNAKNTRHALFTLIRDTPRILRVEGMSRIFSSLSPGSLVLKILTREAIPGR